jgi:hypothetical protein
MSEIGVQARLVDSHTQPVDQQQFRLLPCVLPPSSNFVHACRRWLIRNGYSGKELLDKQLYIVFIQ